jgi:tRNA 5-methylaminomethyl-2-thiouridine biosynthesis bifunctional protein
MASSWHGQAQWCVLETDFGDGQHFLTTWAQWKADPHRPRLLHYCAITPSCPSGGPPLSHELAAQWSGLIPGFHRISLDHGQVLLTLCVGELQAMLRELAFCADSLVLTGLSAENEHTVWRIHTLKNLARCCRRGTQLTPAPVSPTLRDGLVQCGFDLSTLCFNPTWEPKQRQTVPPPTTASTCVVIGAGLAGAAVAASLVRRGWQVTVLDVASTPAQGASALPAGLLSPHVSPDDGTLSRLSRNGGRITLQAAQAWLKEGQDWQQTGVLEHRVDSSPGLIRSAMATPASRAAHAEWSMPATPAQLAAAGLPPGSTAIWHTRAAWIKPAALVLALLNHPHITWQGNSAVARLYHHSGLWQVQDTEGAVLATAPLVVVAAAYTSAGLLATAGSTAPPLQALRGQVSLGINADEHETVTPMPTHPVNGYGSFIPRFPHGDTVLWAAGATFERDVADTQSTPEDIARRDAENHQRLQVLLPNMTHPPQATQAFVGIRCASPDRLPLVGPVSTGLWVSTAMGSRGLSLALLCGELLAARLHGEPLPLEARLAKRLDVQRNFSTRPVTFGTPA